MDHRHPLVEREGMLSLGSTSYRVNFARRYRLGRPSCAHGPMKCKCGRFDSKESTFHHHDGDHDESDRMERQGLKTVGHNVLANQVVKFMKECGWQS